MWNVISGFVESLADVTEEDTLFERLEAAARDLDYPFFAFGSLWGDPDAFGDQPAPAVRLNYPQAWIDHYFAVGYDRQDPVILVAPYAQTSVTWDDLRPNRPEFFADAAAHGLRAGITVTLRSVQGSYVLSLAAERPRTISQTQRARLELFAYGFFSAYLRIRTWPADHGLSDNTVQVIRLSMAGLSPAEIADRLGLSTPGVYWCIKDAKKRLGCTTQAQMHLAAIQRGLVAF